MPTALNATERGGTAFNGKPSLTVEQAAAQLTRFPNSWNSFTDASPACTCPACCGLRASGSGEPGRGDAAARSGADGNGALGLGQPVSLSYAFRADPPGVLPDGVVSFSRFSAQQVRAAELALASWSDVANVSFVRVQEGDGYSNAATILFGNFTADPDANGAAFAYLPGSRAPESFAGDIWIRNSLSYNANPQVGEYGQQVFAHEVGHAIGLSHPSVYDASDEGEATYEANASYFEDSRQYSIMSYFASSNTGGQSRTFAASPQMDDIAAAQRLYGANYSTRADDTVYGFNSTADRPWYRLNAATDNLYASVWDGGGVDTFDFSRYFDGQRIDLRQGAISDVGGSVGNLSIALGAVIENAVGGSGADTLTGNASANVLIGADGVDALFGDGGADRLFGNAGDDRLLGGSGADFLSGEGGADYLAGGDDDDQLFGSTEGDNLAGEAGADDLYGEDGDDALGGGLGNDRVFGGAGRDLIFGEDGNDAIFGGPDDDLAFGGSGSDNLAGEGGNDSLFGEDGNDAVGGGTGDDRLSGGIGADLLFGEDGNDVLNGNDDDDIASGGAGADNLAGEGGNDLLYGDGDADAIGGGRGDDRLFGGDGDDIVFGEDGSDYAAGGAGADTLFGGSGVDNLAGQDGNDLLFGGADTDFVGGGVGDDVLAGEQGDDFLYGEDGRDILVGGAGRDEMTGGPGADVFRFDTVFDSFADRITDHNPGEGDLVDLSGIDADSRTAVNDAFVFVGAFSGAAGQAVLAYDRGANVSTLRLDVNGDAVADLSLLINGFVDTVTGWVL